METKYCICRGMPILFSAINHSDMECHGKIESAGFFRIVDGKVETYGRSESLKMTPDPIDNKLIELFLGLRKDREG